VTPSSTRPVIVCSRAWHARESELSFTIRALAGAASRSAPVIVLVPGRADVTEADGAFDLIPVGEGLAGMWPDHPDLHLLGTVPSPATVMVDHIGLEIEPVLAALGSPARMLSLIGEDARATALRVVEGEPSSPGPFVGLHVPINPLAATHRHNGFGFVDYVLVLSGRGGTHDLPPDEAAWVTAAYPEANVVVVEQAVASVWRGRALRGTTPVDTRTDLWRLVAHARVCIDLSPGSIVAKECVESLRYGTPIIVPSTSTSATVHARAGGGLTYSSMGELVQCVARFDDEGTRQSMSMAGQRYADATYGDPNALTAKVAEALLAVA
jgi:hypothetical protein